MAKSLSKFVFVFLIVIVLKLENLLGGKTLMNEDNETRDFFQNNSIQLTGKSQTDSLNSIIDTRGGFFSTFESSIWDSLDDKNIAKSKINDVEANMGPVIELVSLLTDNKQGNSEQEKPHFYSVNSVPKSKEKLAKLKAYLCFSLIVFVGLLTGIFIGNNFLTRVSTYAKPFLDEDEDSIYQNEINLYENILKNKLMEFYDGEAALRDIDRMNNKSQDNDEKYLLSSIKNLIQHRLDFEEALQKDNSYEFENVTYIKLRCHFAKLAASFEEANELLRLMSERKTFFRNKINPSDIDYLAESCVNVVKWLDEQFWFLNKSTYAQQVYKKEVEKNIIKQWMRDTGTNDVFRAVRIKAKQEVNFQNAKYFLVKQIAENRYNNEEPILGFMYALTGTKTALPFRYNKPQNDSEGAEESRNERIRIGFMQEFFDGHQSPGCASSLIAASLFNKYTAFSEEDKITLSSGDRKSFDIFVWKKQMISLLLVNDRMVMKAKTNHVENAKKWIVVRRRATIEFKAKLMDVTKHIENGIMNQRSISSEISEYLKSTEDMEGIIKDLDEDLKFFEHMTNSLRNGEIFVKLDVNKPIVPQIVKSCRKHDGSDREILRSTNNIKPIYNDRMYSRSGFLSASSVVNAVKLE